MDLKFSILAMKQEQRMKKQKFFHVFIADAIPRKCKTENHFQLL